MCLDSIDWDGKLVAIAYRCKDSLSCSSLERGLYLLLSVVTGNRATFAEG